MSKKTKWNLAGTGVMLSLAFVGLVTQASAQSYDSKGYGSNLCTADVPISHKLGYAYITDGSPSGMMYCPAIKDRVGSDYTQAAQIRLYDNSSSYDIDCNFYLLNENGGSYDWDSASTSGTPGNTTLSMTLSTGATYLESSYVMACLFNTAGLSLRMKSYRLNEYNTHD